MSFFLVGMVPISLLKCLVPSISEVNIRDQKNLICNMYTRLSCPILLLQHNILNKPLLLWTFLPPPLFDKPSNHVNESMFLWIWLSFSKSVYYRLIERQAWASMSDMFRISKIQKRIFPNFVSIKLAITLYLFLQWLTLWSPFFITLTVRHRHISIKGWTFRLDVSKKICNICRKKTTKLKTVLLYTELF